MIIEKMIKNNELERIKEIVKDLEVVGCKETFIKYMKECCDNKDALSPVEKAFYNALESRMPEMAYENLILGYNAQDYQEGLQDAYFNGFWALNERDLDELLECLTYGISDADCYDIIVKYMNKAIDAIEEKAAYDDKHNKEKLIATVQKQLVEATEKMQELERELEALKNN